MARVAAVVGERQHRAAVRHQRGGAPGGLGEGEAGDHHGAHEILARRVGVAALELVLVREGDRVDEEVERAPLLPRASPNTASTEAMSSTSQGMHDFEPTDSRQRLDALAERVALIGEGELGAVRGERPGDAPGDRMVVGDAHDQPALACINIRNSMRPARRQPTRCCRCDPSRVRARLRTSDALVPPKPKEFDSTQPSVHIVAPLAHDRHVGEGRIEVLDIGALADEAVVHHQQRIDRLLHAGRAERMAGQRLGRRDRRASSSPNTSRIASISLRSPTGVEVACGLM